MARASRRERRQKQGHGVVPQLPWQRVDNPYPPMEPLSADQVEAIHQASLNILENLGIEVMGEDVQALFRDAGASVDESSGIVRLDRGIVEQALATAPSSFTLTPRNLDHAITVGGNRINFGFVSGAPNVHDRINGRRAGNMADFEKLMKFAQSFNCVHFMGNQVAPPIELPPNNRHLDTYRAALTLTDKVISGVPIGGGRIRDLIEMVAIVRGLPAAALQDDPSVIGNININSPRKLDLEMAHGAMMLARHNQATIVTPFTLMGAMTPVTMAAALAQQNAEALLGITLTQLVRPGAPVVYGAFTSNVDMRSGAPTFGTPENAKANMAGAQLARRYGLPHRTSACNASNTVDAQAAYETEMALTGAVFGHGNLIYHAVGWLEGGLVASFEKIVLDVELVQHMMGLLSPIDTSDAALGLDAIADVAPGGHFFGSPHTMARYDTAFYQPILSDWRNSQAWEEAGGQSATERATAVWQQVLAGYQQPAMDPARVEALDAYIRLRREEIGDGEP
ncbi:methyltransferase [Hwanghaeella grinnelliae]|uniref:Methyltransferase n=1 Tax=Hwanghaeella grinnelliae TaxID=2500179 RepID=A0A437QH28_9PROT|nr:trimethylamine methyltransferase family protein [Hwanghaeella grinnelliae]RVU33869.1 methyltransferase [Hwanghaeella grinnelliae]